MLILCPVHTQIATNRIIEHPKQNNENLGALCVLCGSLIFNIFTNHGTTEGTESTEKTVGGYFKAGSVCSRVFFKKYAKT